MPQFDNVYPKSNKLLFKWVKLEFDFLIKILSILGWIVENKTD